MWFVSNEFLEWHRTVTVIQATPIAPTNWHENLKVVLENRKVVLGPASHATRAQLVKIQCKVKAIYHYTPYRKQLKVAETMY